ncbi:heat-stable 19 kDa antigen precursor [Cordyceps fumosorosea ARSEF 2679]|uniref:Heat-stable 19 kDa antigen n=1 Tax=Cordyceps fumosorosea (strain ARSEF 2679) TaxID=1081104 RepID=A0A167R0Y5_CORFA|nr:heat-stable 19 kDa antigen precursor [Cordyceps fumosorosea ARSEF 2679]OAA58169.1 heat-stable 19 kDa antigen precursor [Cordyceps fumosorosea ARSEF 2679]
MQISSILGLAALATYATAITGQVPRFPYIGGAEAVSGWNSPACGTCWRLDYQGRSITVLAVDRAVTGFNIAKAALDGLTGGRAVEVGRVNAEATQVDPKICGL